MESLPYDFASCAVCLEQMKDRKPRFLKCHHSFCESCLESLVKQGKITCPKCRAKTLVEKNDVQKLTLNFQLLEFFDEMKTTKGNLICHYHRQIKALKICETCSKLLCKECITKHGKIPRLRGHTLLNLGWACKEHCEVFTGVCKTCSVPVCDMCLTEHDHHHVEQVEAKKYIDAAAAKLQNMKSTLENGVTEIRQFRAEDCKDKKYTQQMKLRLVKVIETLKGKVNEGEEILKYIEENEKNSGEIIKKYDQFVYEFSYKTQELEKFYTYQENYTITDIIDLKRSTENYLAKMKEEKLQRYFAPSFDVPRNLYSVVQNLQLRELKRHHGKMQHLTSMIKDSQQPCSAKTKETAAVGSSEWTCNECNFINDKDSDDCVACGNTRQQKLSFKEDLILGKGENQLFKDHLIHDFPGTKRQETTKSTLPQFDIPEQHSLYPDATTTVKPMLNQQLTTRESKWQCQQCSTYNPQRAEYCLICVTTPDF